MMLRILLLLSWLPASIAAQEPETLVADSSANGGFGGPTLHVTSLNGRLGVFMGGHGGWIIGHRFVIGGGARGLVGSEIDAPITSQSGERLYLTLGYGGLELQYIHNPWKLLHPSFQVLLGGGSADYRDGGTVTSSSFFAAEPAAILTLNIAGKIHLSGGASYRLISGTSLPGLSDADLSGWSALLGLEFGRF